MFRQIFEITRLNLANMGSRLGTSMVLVVGIAGVVAVLLGIRAMSSGLTDALVNTTHADRGLILRNGSNSEMEGWISQDELGVIKTYAGFAHLSPELYVTINVPLTDHRPEHVPDPHDLAPAYGLQADVVARGVTSTAFDLRQELQIVQGRTFTPGKSEVIVGQGAAREYPHLAVGNTIAARNTDFTIVGHFSAAGGSAESEVWMDLPVAANTFRRSGANVVRVALTDPGQAAQLNERLENDRRITATLIMERAFFARMASARTGLINTFAYTIAAIMAVGVVIAALNTMYTIVSKRRLEIATLRALGFKPGAVVTSVMLESMCLALIGGVLGGAIAFFGFDGLTGATQNGTGSQTAFTFSITVEMITQSILLALLLGFFGGTLPAAKSARLPVAAALRPA